MKQPEESIKPDYSRWTLKRLQKQLETVKCRLEVLAREFPSDEGWQARALRHAPTWPGWNDADIPDHTREFRRLEEQRQGIALELSKRVRPNVPRPPRQADRLAQDREQLEDAGALIEDARFEIMLGLPGLALLLGAAELRVHVFALDNSLRELSTIVERRLKGHDGVRDASEWAELVVKVQSRLKHVRELGSNIGGRALARLPEHLPSQLPSTQPVQMTKAIVETESSHVQNSANSAQLSSPTVGSQSDLWKYFSNEFEQLAREEERLERAAPKDRLLRAYCDYKEHPVVWERGKPEQGCFCLLKAPETGLWTYSDGVSENFQARSRALTSRAGLALGSPKDTDPEDFWLHRLYRDLLENNSDQLFAASDEGGVILRVCEASATFCSWLERMALAESSSVQNNLKSTQDMEGMSTHAAPTPPAEDVKAKQDNAVAEFGDVLTATGGRHGWISAALGIQEGSKSTNAEAVRFTHTEDYRTVAIRGETYTLTPRQAQMIQILHEAHENVTPDVAIDNILERLETPNSRWQDMWRTSKEAQSALIESGTRKGTLRLNL